MTHHRRERNTQTSARKLILVIPAIILLASTASYTGNVHSAAVYPTQDKTTPSAVSGPFVLVMPFNVAQMAVGSAFTIQVQVWNMPQFNGWDIQVSVDPTVLNATSLSIAGNDFAVNASSGTAFEIVHCVNGLGTGCTSSDRLGIVHSAYGNTATLTGNGLLFTVTYKVVGNGPYSQINLVNDLISSPSSGNGVSHGSIYGVYGVLYGGGGAKGGGKALDT